MVSFNWKLSCRAQQPYFLHAFDETKVVWSQQHKHFNMMERSSLSSEIEPRRNSFARNTQNHGFWTIQIRDLGNVENVAAQAMPL